jgi:hypothetical protein
MARMSTRTFSELSRRTTFAERYRYLALHGQVGDSTFGFDRWINQQFYRSREWRYIRNHVIARDNGCDLGVEGYEIYERVIIHHLNPLSAEEIVHGDEAIVDPEFLITTTLNTHNAIHYGDERLLPRPLAARRPGDTALWSRKVRT